MKNALTRFRGVECSLVGIEARGPCFIAKSDGGGLIVFSEL